MSSSSLPPLCTTSSSSSSCTISAKSTILWSSSFIIAVYRPTRRFAPISPFYRRFAIVGAVSPEQLCFRKCHRHRFPHGICDSLHRSGNSIYQFGRRAFLLVMFAMDVVTARIHSVFFLFTEPSHLFQPLLKKDRTRPSTSSTHVVAHGFDPPLDPPLLRRPTSYS